jgi:catechol 2,3-dioxygenase-like lactoylglutathione lyase family enzyme
MAMDDGAKQQVATRLPPGLVASATTPKGLDHLVIAVRDLDMAGAFYERLGFKVGARNRHPWGTHNRIVQFPGAFLELITVGDAALIPPHAPGFFSFGAFVAESLKRREGLAMVVLESRDSKADAIAFSEAGIGDFAPFFFERQGTRPDGSPMRVAFTLAFAQDLLAPECAFFVCQQHEPQNFWNAAFQQHENGASGLSAALMLAENPTDHHIFLEAFTGQRGPRSSSLGLSFPLPRGRLDVMTPGYSAALIGEPSLAALREPRFTGFCVTVPDFDRITARLQAAGIPAMRNGPRLVVPASAAFGTAILFEQVA